MASSLGSDVRVLGLGWMMMVLVVDLVMNSDPDAGYAYLVRASSGPIVGLAVLGAAINTVGAVLSVHSGGANLLRVVSLLATLAVDGIFLALVAPVELQMQAGHFSAKEEKREATEKIFKLHTVILLLHSLTTACVLADNNRSAASKKSKKQ